MNRENEITKHLPEPRRRAPQERVDWISNYMELADRIIRNAADEDAKQENE